MASFREEHNRIINEENKFNVKNKRESSLDLSPKSNDEDMKKINSVKTSIEEEKKKLKMSMEEEINLDLINTLKSQNLAQALDDENKLNWKSNTDELFKKEKSVKGIFTNSGTIHSDDFLTYSLTNTLKTLSSKAGTK
jgi:exonuclease I